VIITGKDLKIIQVSLYENLKAESISEIDLGDP